jgi:hypothetical protein
MPAVHDTEQDKMDANVKEKRAGEELLKEEILTKLDAHHERVRARMDSQLEKVETCLGKKEAMNLEASLEEIKSEVDCEEVPKEETTVETGALKEQYKNWHLAIRCCGQPKKWVPEEVGYQLQRDDLPCRSDMAIRDKTRSVFYKEAGKENV